MANENNFKKTLQLIFDSVDYIKKVNSDDEMNDAYVDSFTTKEQRLRDKKVTELLELYVSGYKYKNNSNKWYKGILLGVSCLILLAFSIVFMVLMFKMDFDNDVKVASVVQLISICVTFLTLIVGILTIITKYVFPENEEEYITRIVEIIQNNDLENKKENIRAQLKNLEDSVDSPSDVKMIDEL
ncbi:MAG: hypothetical protein J6C01_09585 [Lachnospiraceae bacterium]|nr:hypothetical protein [Lachnospiraceae bacterium]